MILNLILVLDNINYTSRDMEITEDMESTINGWCSDQTEYIISGLDSSEKMEFNYVSSKIKLNGESREDGEAYAHTNGNVVIEKEVRGDIEFIPDAMISSEFIENRNNELGGEQRDKSSPDEIQRVGGGAEVEKSVGRGGKKVNKKKIHKNDKKVGVVGGENIVRKNRGVVPCDQGHCHKTFDSKWNMKRHLEAETKIKCDHCEKCLMGPTNLMSHMKRKHEEFLKKLGCETCDEKFVSEKSLNNHMKKHDPTIGEGKFQCDVCEKYFSNKFSLERHKKVIHKELILLNGGILVKVNTFLKDHTLVSSKGEVMEECEGDSEAFEFLKKIVNIE